ncbi:MAG: porin [Planctomycetaceae bacterium]|nr:porin [Planctomycetaceae bacterium]
MKKQIVSAIMLAAVIAFVAFDEKATAADCFPDPCDSVCPAPCDPCEKDSFCKYLTEKSVFESRLFENSLIGRKSKSRIYFTGWVLTGITANNHGSTNSYGPHPSGYGYNNRLNSAGTGVVRNGYNDQSGNSCMLMTEHPADWKVNQLWFGARRDLTNTFDWGFHADFAYGTDARYARNWSDRSFDYKWGSGDYFAAFTQLYGTLGTKDLYVKVGKFGGGFNHETMAAPREFFYSHANLCFGGPLTASGVSIEWKPNPKWSFSSGWLAGTFNSFENPYGDNGFLGKATYHFTKDASLSYHIFYNDRGSRPPAPFIGTHNGVIECHHTLIFRWKLSPKWFYMGEVVYADTKMQTHAGSTLGAHSAGVNNHLIYTVNEKLSVGFRGEFHHAHASAFDNRAVSGGQGGDIWTATFAAQYKINPKTTFRPELRYDYADYRNGYRPFGGNATKKDQLCGGVSFIVMF